MADSAPVEEHWHFPPAEVTFVVCRGWRRFRAYVNTVTPRIAYEQPRFRGKTPEAALEKAKAYARKTWPEAIVPDKPRVTYLP